MIQEVKVEVVLKENSRVRLHPSYAFAGIQKGDVQVIGIYTPEDFDSIKPLREAVQCDVDAVMGSTPYDQLDKYDKEIVDILWSSNWVGYVYTRNQVEGIQYMALPTFIDHMTVC